jgi:hypothetical protein
MTVAEADSLKLEASFFEQHREELVERANGKFALVKGESLVGIFDSQIEAIRAGYQRFGNEAFLVKHVVRVEIPLNFTSFHVGV